MELNIQSLVLIFLMSFYECNALQYLLCQNLAPLRCKNGGILYVKSVTCHGYDYAMQLLQENCSGRTSCPVRFVPELLQSRCCGKGLGTPQIIYQCTSGSADTPVDPPNTGGIKSTFQQDGRGHPPEDQVVIVVVPALIVFLWGCGLLFFYLRYNSSQCTWLYRKRRPRKRTITEPVYATAEPPSSERYVEIHSFSSPCYTNIHPPGYTVPSAPTSTVN